MVLYKYLYRNTLYLIYMYKVQGIGYLFIQGIGYIYSIKSVRQSQERAESLQGLTHCKSSLRTGDKAPFTRQGLLDFWEGPN